MFDTMMTMIDACRNDVDFFVENDIIHLTINDFEGFDDDWNEIIRDYDDFDAVNRLLDWLNKNCISKTDDFYVVYSFNDFKVELGYTSFDI